MKPLTLPAAAAGAGAREAAAPAARALASRHGRAAAGHGPAAAIPFGEALGEALGASAEGATPEAASPAAAGASRERKPGSTKGRGRSARPGAEDDGAAPGVPAPGAAAPSSAGVGPAPPADASRLAARTVKRALPPPGVASVAGADDGSHGRDGSRRAAGRAERSHDRGAERAASSPPAFPPAARADAPLPVPAPEHRSGPRAAAAVAAPEAPALPLPAAPPGHAVEGAVLRSAAHLRIETAAMGDLSLHLRVRDGSLHLRVEGEAAHLVEARAGELSRALASEGLKLAPVELPSREGTGLGSGASGQQGQPGGSRQQAWNDAADARPEAASFQKPAGRDAAAGTASPPRRIHRGHVDIEA